MPRPMLIDVVHTVAHQEVMPRFLNVGVSKKEDGSLLSEADLASQAAFMQLLPTLRDCPILGEEMTRSEQQALWLNGQTSGLWVVDPIDGTNNFVNGLPHFALSTALIVNHKAEEGVIYSPITRETFYAKRGHGAFLNGKRLTLNVREKSLSDAIAGVEVKYLKSGRLASRIHTLLPVGSRRNMGCSTLDWCYLASGRYDVYLHGGQKLWDYAAGALIYEEAGGQLATLEGDDFWSGEHTFCRSVIAALQPNLFELWRAWVLRNQ